MKTIICNKSFMTGTIKLISVIVMLQSFTSPILAGQVMDNEVDIRVMEERINWNEEKTDMQVKALKNEVNLRSDSLEKQMNLYIGVAGLVLLIVSFLGYKTTWLHA